MKGIWLDTPSLQVSRKQQGLFEVQLKSREVTLAATEVETHHFARVLVAMKRLGISRTGKALKSASEDFAIAVLGHKNYYIRRMYFSVQPETIAQWYLR